MKWVEEELLFWQQNSFAGDVMLSRETVRVNISVAHRRRLEAIQKELTATQPTYDGLGAYILDAERLKVIIGEGPIARGLLVLRQDHPSIALRLAASFSTGADDLPEEALIELAELRGLALLTPALLVSAKFSSAEELLRRSKKSENAATSAEATSSATKDELDKYLASKTNEVEALRTLYLDKLKLEAPAKYWERTSRISALKGYFFLVFFAGGIFGPVWFIAPNWSQISTFLFELVKQSGNQFTLTPFVIITLPALAYGWLLRHISRIVIHNLNLADDADYRRVMTMVFLGLQKQNAEDSAEPVGNATNVSDTERALILNALFRPVPSSATDEGPPNGLLSLINGKP